MEKLPSSSFGEDVKRDFARKIWWHIIESGRLKLKVDARHNLFNLSSEEGKRDAHELRRTCEKIFGVIQLDRNVLQNYKMVGWNFIKRAKTVAKALPKIGHKKLLSRRAWCSQDRQETLSFPVHRTRGSYGNIISSVSTTRSDASPSSCSSFSKTPSFGFKYGKLLNFKVQLLPPMSSFELWLSSVWWQMEWQWTMVHICGVFFFSGEHFWNQNWGAVVLSSSLNEWQILYQFVSRLWLTFTDLFYF